MFNDAASALILANKKAQLALTIEEILAIPKEHYPLIMYCNGGSLFSWAIKGVDNSVGSHVEILYDRDKIATQWWWFKTIPVMDIQSYTVKFIWNTKWTQAQRDLMIQATKDRLALGKWKTRYDVLGIFGELFNIEGMQKRAIDFCSESVVRIISAGDLNIRNWWETTCKSPTPRELNLYTKTHQELGYAVYGYYVTDDEIYKCLK